MDRLQDKQDGMKTKPTVRISRFQRCSIFPFYSQIPSYFTRFLTGLNDQMHRIFFKFLCESSLPFFLCHLASLIEKQFRLLLLLCLLNILSFFDGRKNGKCSVTLDVHQQQVDVFVTHSKDTHFYCPECNEELSVYEHSPERVWRHLDSFQFIT
jgi:hypothetical protein